MYANARTCGGHFNGAKVLYPSNAICHACRAISRETTMSRGAYFGGGNTFHESCKFDDIWLRMLRAKVECSSFKNVTF